MVENCVWGAWQNGDCSVTCGDGTRTNTRSKTVVENNLGGCTGAATEQESCNDQSCPPEGGNRVFNLFDMIYY